MIYVKILFNHFFLDYSEPGFFFIKSKVFIIAWNVIPMGIKGPIVLEVTVSPIILAAKTLFAPGSRSVNASLVSLPKSE